MTEDALTFDDFAPEPIFGPWYEAALSFSPDGSEVAYVAGSTGLFGLYRQAADGGEPVLVTDGDGAFVHAAFWSPDGRWIAYTAYPADGGEAQQVFLISPESGPARAVTMSGAAHQLGRTCWSPDGRRLAYAANGGGGADIMVYDVEAEASRRLTGGGSIFSPGSWSPDGRRLLAVEERTGGEIRLVLVDVTGGEVTELVEAPDGVTFVPGPWLPGGESALVLTNLGGEFLGLSILDLKTGQFDWLHAPAWDVERVVQSADGTVIAWCVNEDGFSRLYLARSPGAGEAVGDEPPAAVTAVPSGVIHGLALAPDGRTVAVITSGAARPYQVSVVDPAAATRRVLDGRLSAKVSALPLPDAESVTYTSFDGRTIHGLLMRPPGPGRHGVVVALHGGPHIQERPNYAYSGLYQYLVSQGVGVFAPNMRGSSGYGATFEGLVLQRWGYEDVDDLRAAHAYLCGLSWVDPDRIGQFGFCYGGFVGLCALAGQPDDWGATVCWGPVSDLVDLVHSAPPGGYESRALMVGDPERSGADMAERSPITHAERIRAPLLLIHGREDTQVPIHQSERLAERVRAGGTPVEFVEQDGHGFADAESLLDACRSTAAFLIRHLGRAGEAAS
jgi:dipeptidyl aminopeptidase/acylaminoacyl peptidase